MTTHTIPAWRVKLLIERLNEVHKAAEAMSNMLCNTRTPPGTFAHIGTIQGLCEVMRDTLLSVAITDLTVESDPPVTATEEAA